MRFAPTTAEQQALNDSPLEERFHYAITRICECEEVWGLGGEAGWLIREDGDTAFICVWPYRQMALEYAREGGAGGSPICVSLEQFIYDLLKQCIDAEINLEVNPAPGQSGYVIKAADLYEILENQVESGTYFLEG